jgi:hypothetical protein
LKTRKNISKRLDGTLEVAVVGTTSDV